MQISSILHSITPQKIVLFIVNSQFSNSLFAELWGPYHSRYTNQGAKIDHRKMKNHTLLLSRYYHNHDYLHPVYEITINPIYRAATLWSLWGRGGFEQVGSVYKQWFDAPSHTYSFPDCNNIWPWRFEKVSVTFVILITFYDQLNVHIKL
jgi:hypothetical protein